MRDIVTPVNLTRGRAGQSAGRCRLASAERSRRGEKEETGGLVRRESNEIMVWSQLTGCSTHRTHSQGRTHGLKTTNILWLSSNKIRNSLAGNTQGWSVFVSHLLKRLETFYNLNVIHNAYSMQL